MSRHAVEEGDPQQQQTGTHEAHQHVAHAGGDGAVPEMAQDQAAGADGVDLGGRRSIEKDVGVDQRQVGGQHHVQHDVVEVRFAGEQAALRLPSPSQQGEEDDQAEQHRQRRLQHAGPEFVSPWGRVVAHHVGVGDRILHQERQKGAVHQGQQDAETDAEAPRVLPVQREGQDRREHRY